MHVSNVDVLHIAHLGNIFDTHHAIHLCMRLAVTQNFARDHSGLISKLKLSKQKVQHHYTLLLKDDSLLFALLFPSSHVHLGQMSKLFDLTARPLHVAISHRR